MRRFLVRLAAALATAGAYVAGGLTVFVMATVSYEVVTRKLVGTSLTWVVDFGQAALLFITFLAAPWVLKEDAHVKIDVVTSRLSPPSRDAVGTGTAIVASGVMLLLAIVGAQEALADLRTGRTVVSSAVYPRVWISLVIPVGSLALAIGFAVRAWRCFRRARAGRTHR